MVRQRKCHTRMKKEFFAQLAGETMLDGQPIERTIEEGLWRQQTELSTVSFFLLLHILYTL